MNASDEERSTPGWLRAAVFAGVNAWSLLVNLWFAPRGLYEPLWHVSGGWIDPALQVSLPALSLFLVAMRAAGVKFGDCGWRRQGLVAAVLATATVWLLLQAFVALWPEPILFDPYRLPSDDPRQLLGQLFGVALLEETVFRGFFVVQFLWVLRGRGWMRIPASLVATAAAALLFALPHVPNRIYLGTYHGIADVGVDLLQLWAGGVLFGWMYLRTRNLWWCVGVHALANAPALLPGTVMFGSVKEVVAVLAIVVTLAWPRTFGRTRRPG